jgi:hypothetical protein
LNEPYYGKKFFASFFQERRFFFSGEKKQKTFYPEGPNAIAQCRGEKNTPAHEGGRGRAKKISRTRR